jgi:hypothetical protein
MWKVSTVTVATKFRTIPKVGFRAEIPLESHILAFSMPFDVGRSLAEVLLVRKASYRLSDNRVEF